MHTAGHVCTIVRRHAPFPKGFRLNLGIYAKFADSYRSHIQPPYFPSSSCLQGSGNVIHVSTSKSSLQRSLHLPLTLHSLGHLRNIPCVWSFIFPTCRNFFNYCILENLSFYFIISLLLFYLIVYPAKSPKFPLVTFP
jgi:hypothetical protein